MNDSGIAVLQAFLTQPLPWLALLLGVWQHRGEGDRRLLQPLLLGMVLGTALGGLALWALVSGGDLNLVHRRMEVLVALL